VESQKIPNENNFQGSISNIQLKSQEIPNFKHKKYARCNEIARQNKKVVDKNSLP